MSYRIGIDIGGLTVKAAVSSGSGATPVRLGQASLFLPSAVSVRDDGSIGLPKSPDVPDSTLWCHQFHRYLGDSTPFPIGDRSFTGRELMTGLLVDVLARAGEHLGGPPSQIALTCPSAWGPYRREQFDEAVRSAALPEQQVTVISEAEAVIAHHRHDRGRAGQQVIAVYDIGGSSCSATVVHVSYTGELRVIGVPDSLEFQGGLDIVRVLAHALDERLAGRFSQLGPQQWNEMEQQLDQAKEILSRQETTEFVCQGERVHLTRQDLVELIAPYIVEGFLALRRALDSARVRPDELSDVLLTGGAAQMPFIATALEKSLGRPVTLVGEPQFAAALGAALPTR